MQLRTSEHGDAHLTVLAHVRHKTLAQSAGAWVLPSGAANGDAERGGDEDEVSWGARG